MNAFTSNALRKQEDQACGFSHDYVRIDGRRIHCITAGQGAPVLLIPGWPQTWYAWRHVMQALAAQGFQAIAVDPPGTGFSDRPDTGYDTGSIALTLHRTMLALGHERYQVAGHDVGMWVAYALASDQPQAVQSLALTEAVIPGLAPEPSIFAPPEQNIFLWHFMFNQLADLPETLIAGASVPTWNSCSTAGRCGATAWPSTSMSMPMRRPVACAAALPTTAPFPKPSARTASVRCARWPCPCWPLAPSMPRPMRRWPRCAAMPMTCRA